MLLERIYSSYSMSSSPNMGKVKTSVSSRVCHDAVEGLIQFFSRRHHLSYNGYTICSDPAQMAGAFRALRNIPLSTSIKGAKIVSIRDVISGTDTAAYDGRCDLPSAGGTDFITFRFTSGLEVDDPKPDLVVSFRASGTEPKFKYYSELRCPTSLITEARMRLSSVVQALIDATSTSQS